MNEWVSVLRLDSWVDVAGEAKLDGGGSGWQVREKLPRSKTDGLVWFGVRSTGGSGRMGTHPHTHG